MEQMTDTTIAFIGLGLIGGSIARGIKRARPDIHIMAYMRTRSKLEQARQDGIVDEILDGVDSRLSRCDLIFLCTPVEYNAQYLATIRPFLKQGALITDVGSTKTKIHEEILSLGLEDCFVGGHPMAGSEKTGYENSTDHLLENAYYIITPARGLAPEGEASGASSSAAEDPSPNVQRIVRVAETEGAVGYCSLALVDDSVVGVSVDGVEPTQENVQNGSYGLNKTMVMATMGPIGEQSELIQNFFDFVYSEEGEAQIEAANLIPIPRAEG